MQKTRVIVSWSSGKDSALALLRLLENEAYEVVGLFTTYVNEIVPIQETPLPVVQAQARAIGLPLITSQLPKVFPENAVYQKQVITSLQNSNLQFDAIAFGDLFCDGIAEFRKNFIEPAGYQCLFPLMGENSTNLASEIITRGIKTFICTIDTTQLTPKHIGHPYNQTFLNALPPNIDPCGENGEFHTLVHDAPCFKSPLLIELQNVTQQEQFHHQRYHLQQA